ncbi:DUF6090 family protein [Roseivirga sp.]|uniref:DUF6090 family protein n=1 Tax=Roseivirga sp. TaxID=1964215 RepID=UPI003B8C9E23
MFNFLRKFRRNNSSKYFKYAFGEIILVVIGILIALSISNWNENRKKRQRTETILSQIIEELKLDIQTFNALENEFHEKDSLIDVFLQSDFSIASSQNLDSAEFIDLIRTYIPFQIHNRGFQLLMDHTDEIQDSYAEEVEQLIILYQDAAGGIETFMDGLLEVLEEHKKYKYENFDWYAQGSLTLITPDAEYSYYMRNPKYRNYMAVYREMYFNLVIYTRWFVDLSFQSIDDLNDKMGIENKDTEIFKRVPLELSQVLSGDFLDSDQNIIKIILKDNKLINRTFEEFPEEYRANQEQFYVEELRYLGDSAFYFNPVYDLKLNADMTLSLTEVFDRSKTLFKKKD